KKSSGPTGGRPSAGWLHRYRTAPKNAPAATCSGLNPSRRLICSGVNTFPPASRRSPLTSRARSGRRARAFRSMPTSRRAFSTASGVTSTSQRRRVPRWVKILTSFPPSGPSAGGRRPLIQRPLVAHVTLDELPVGRGQRHVENGLLEDVAVQDVGRA